MNARRLAVAGPLVALLLACTFFTLQSPRFLTGANLSLVLSQVMVVGVLAIGQTLVILTGGIDLACGMIMALGSIVMSLLAVKHGWHPAMAIGGGVVVTTIAGMISAAPTPSRNDHPNSSIGRLVASPVTNEPEP